MKSILIVDDNRDIRLLLRVALESRVKTSIVEATSGTEAISLIDKQSFALIVCDFSMPEGDGLTVFSHLEAHPEIDSAFILFTSAEVQELREKMIVVQKPNLDELMDTVEFFYPDILPRLTGQHMRGAI
jgi:two-component system, chemotaxis family, chemotaxis protein CheY